MKQTAGKTINPGMHLLQILCCIALLALALGVSSVSPAQAGNGGNAHQKDSDWRGRNDEFLSGQTDQLIIKYSDSQMKGGFFEPAGPEQMTQLTDAAGFELTYLRELADGAHVLRLPERVSAEEMQTLIAGLQELPNVEYAEPDLILQHTLTPNDTYFTTQWHYFAPVPGNYGINAPAAWDITTGSADIVIAVIDTGITNHVEFASRTVPGYDFIGDVLVANDGDGRDSSPSDPGDWITEAESESGYFEGCDATISSWHGTHTAGTIGAASNNGTGVTGINWNSKIQMARVLGKCGGYTSDIIDAMRWSAGLSVSGVPDNATPAKVISISLGGSGACGTGLQTAINAINAAGTTIVVASGNSYSDASNFSPGNCNGVITVGATNSNGRRPSFSNYGTTLEISAPGSNVFSTLNTGTQAPLADTYVYYSGTSMATPHVSGVASLMYSCYAALTPAQVLQILQSSATPFPTGSNCNTSICGSGIVNAAAALTTQRAFSKVSPANGAQYQSYSPTLSWGAELGATAYQYCYDTTNDGACTTWVDAAATSAALSGLTPNTTYYWQVRAQDNCGFSYANGSSTAFWSFTTAPVYTISGNTGTGAVTLSYSDGSPMTATADEDGNYSFTVSYNWSGSVTPSKPGFTFAPDHRDYANVQANYSAQDYTATPITYTISGNTGVSGVTLSYSTGTPQSVISDGNGDYAFIVPYLWSGSVTPSLPGYTFTPANRSYTDTNADQAAQDYAAQAISITGTISMQGRSYRGDIPVTLTGLLNGPYQATSIDALNGNLVFPMVIEDTYTFTTLQPRYLNVTAALGKTIAVSAARAIASLELKGGNAVWSDNVIDILDASLMGAAYGATGVTSDADVNFDGVVNILDLSLMGANYNLTSASVYASWTP